MKKYFATYKDDKAKRRHQELRAASGVQSAIHAQQNTEINREHVRHHSSGKHIPDFIRDCKQTPPLRFDHSDEVPRIETIHIYQMLATITCNQKNHIIVNDKKEITSALTEEIVEIPIHRCETCGKVFISQEMWNQYVLHGIAQIYQATSDVEELNLANETQLHSLGYRVGKTGLSASERRALLFRLVSSHKMTWFQIHRDINTDLRIHRNNPLMQQAVADWRADLKWVGQKMKG